MMSSLDAKDLLNTCSVAECKDMFYRILVWFYLFYLNFIIFHSFSIELTIHAMSLFIGSEEEVCEGQGARGFRTSEGLRFSTSRKTLATWGPSAISWEFS